ncbi:hypothetical protein BDV95DRAFT_601776 [Massariosphaeria phaeospora]|uniref:Zn(2)-C6 fungal-type domain-containing protein n=1 Tax=Massariosphaeria phaeospora TaxID=100035 RepID=A0A7C8ILP4_9PLEO|nr:hypothetical protein BDV95DRAFT_601776 [Massariosphaeria phaeospora]
MGDDMASTHAHGPSDSTRELSPTGNTANSAKMRKRTKTGCLTCRKRRIKCGEERPTCANCIKSKRQCEGYNQRVVFKAPIGEWPNHPGVSTLQYHNSSLPGTRPVGHRDPSSPTQSQDGTLTPIRPQAMTHFNFVGVDAGHPSLAALNTQQGPVGAPPTYAQDPNYQQPLQSPHHQQPLHSPHHQLPTPTSTTSYFPQPSPVQAAFHGQYAQDGGLAYQEQQRYSQGGLYQQVPVTYDISVEATPAASQTSQDQVIYQQQQRVTHSSSDQASYIQQASTPIHTEGYTQFADHRAMDRYGRNTQAAVLQTPVSSVNMSQAGSYTLPPAVSHPNSAYPSFQSDQIPSHDVKYVPQHAVLEQPSAVSHAQQQHPQIPLQGFGGDDHVSPTQILDEAAIEYQDDDYYDVQSDEEMLDGDEDRQDEDAMILRRDYSLIRRIHAESSNELSVRRYDAFIYDGILSHYQAENVANPLKNPKTARVFAHFVHVTGPSISLYERNPRNPASLFEGPTPPSQQSLWTYTMPLKALNHQVLLHAMLALASLHIAKLQRASVTPSYKHYAYALKRLSRSLGNPRKRLSIQTLGASILLAYYEVWTAEHVKWSTHLVGAAQLLVELNFRSLTQEARRLKAVQTAQEKQFPYQNPDLLIDQRQLDQRLKTGTMMPDEDLVSTIVGNKVSYDDFSRVFEETTGTQEGRSGLPGKLDLRSYETLQDLYWWYSRHDSFQSIISGNRLITDYRKWSDCPPRAPIGRADALYGSNDHIILLLGRIADFTYRDRERKLKQVAANGGQWRPTPGMPGMGGMGGPPSKGPKGQQPQMPTTPMGPPPHMQGRGPPGQGQGSMPQPPRGPPPASTMPNFFGMAPTQGTVPLVSTYVNPDPNYKLHGNIPPTSNAPPPTKSSDLPAAYEAALEEWNSISHAHATIARILTNTETFAPLTSDSYPVSPGGNMTPFGPALIHRRHDISMLWAFLHLCNIILLRSHPAMPPAAMMAASVCAPATQPYAMLIGRITAGMQLPRGENASVTPAFGAALMESTMPLFFAGVQFQDPQQRDWLVTRLLEIDRRVGWATAGVIAGSCETSWEKAAERGGPPYQRRTRGFGDHSEASIDADSSPVASASASASAASSGWPGTTCKVGSVAASRRAREQHHEQNADKNAPLEDSDGDKRFQMRSTGHTTPWAMNLLATDEDLRVGMERVGLSGEINWNGVERARWLRSE